MTDYAIDKKQETYYFVRQGNKRRAGGEFYRLLGVKLIRYDGDDRAYLEPFSSVERGLKGHGISANFGPRVQIEIVDRNPFVTSFGFVN
jgi:hypothetical protein